MPDPVLTGNNLVDKYQQVSDQLAQIKKHNAILKKAILEEQAKNAKLETDIKDKSRRMLQVSEECESLTFNNNRLTKRVEILQDELEKEKNSSGGWFGSGTKQELNKTKVALEQYQEELDTKIKENEELHIHLYESKQEHKTIMEDVMERMAKLKQTIDERNDYISQMSQQMESKINGLSEENKSLMLSKADLENVLKETKHLMVQNEKKFMTETQTLRNQFDEVHQIMKSKIIFDDTRYAKYNVLNLPSVPLTMTKDYSGIKNAAVESFKKLTMHFSAFLSFDKNKLQSNSNMIDGDYFDTINQLVNTADILLSELNNFAEHLNNNLFKGSGPYDIITMTFKKIASSLGTYSTLYTTKTNAENEHITYFNSEMKENNLALAKCASQFHLIVSTADPFLSEFISTLERGSSQSSNIVALQKLSECFDSIRDTMRFSCKISGTMIQLEQNALQKVDANNEKKLESLLDALADLECLSDLLKKYVSDSNTSKIKVRGGDVSPEESTYSKNLFYNKAREYVQRVNEMEPYVHIPYLQQLENQQGLKEAQSALKHKQEEIQSLVETISQQTKQIEYIKNELDSAKDTISLKNKKTSELLSELGDARLKLQQVTESKLKMDTISTSSVPSADLVSLSEDDRSDDLEKDLIDWNSETNISSAPESFASREPNLDTISSISKNQFSTSARIGSITENDGVLLSTQSQHGSDPSKSSSTISNSVTIPSESWSMIVFDEDGKQSNSLRLFDEESTREYKLKQFYEMKMVALSNQVDIANKKLVELNRRCIELDRQLRDAVNKKQVIVKELEDTHSAFKDSKDEVESVRNNYEEQLKVLTEHLVSVSDKISDHQEELSAIKNCTVRCGKCKTWNTIGWLMKEGKMGQICSGGNHPTSFNYA